MTGPRSVLVTGCSRGLGLAAARLLAARGWRVFATTRDPSASPDLAARIGRGSEGVEVVSLDVTDAASIRAAVDQVLAGTGGALYGVVHNAGVGDAGFFEDMPSDAFRRLFETNFFGVVNLTRAVLPSMRATGSGRIIVVSSASVFFAYPWQTAYNASKCALEGWVAGMALELRPFGIRFALVEPGMHRTGIWDGSTLFRPGESPYRLWAVAQEARMRRMATRRGGDPHNVAKVIASVLEARRVRLRYPVGPDAWGARFAGALPDSIQRPIRRIIFGRPVIADRPEEGV